MVIALLILLLSPAWPVEQKKDETGPPKRGDLVIAKGCLTGSALESSDLAGKESPARYYESLTYRLTGEKKTMDEIRKEHAGHSDIVTAELKTDLPTTVSLRGTTIGKTRVVVGMGARPGVAPEPPPPMPVLRVKSFEHTGVTCR